jgi:hypothetical protein
VGAPHLTHPAAAKQVDQLVTAERRPVHRLTINQPAVAPGGIGLRSSDASASMTGNKERFRMAIENQL